MTLINIENYLAKFGKTDTDYLRAHYERFKTTFTFCDALPFQARIIDIGAHWLHQAIFFSTAGYQVTCCDAPNTLELDINIRVALDQGINLVPYTRLDLGRV